MISSSFSFFFFVNHACSFFFFLIMFFTWKRKIGKMLSKGCKRRVVECRSRTWTKTRRRRRRMAPKSNLFPVKNLDTRDSVCDLDRWSPRSCHPPLLWISSSVSADPCLNREKLFHVRLIKKSFFKEIVIDRFLRIKKQNTDTRENCGILLYLQFQLHYFNVIFSYSKDSNYLIRS